MGWGERVEGKERQRKIKRQASASQVHWKSSWSGLGVGEW